MGPRRVVQRGEIVRHRLGLIHHEMLVRVVRLRVVWLGGVVRRPKVLDHVHFHSVDDGMEVFAAQAEVVYRRDEPARARSRLARVERIDIGAPALKLLAPFSTRTSRIRDIVDLSAKGIDFKHGRTLRTRQYPHCIIERAT